MNLNNAAYITSGYKQSICATPGCTEEIQVPPWLAPYACYCDEHRDSEKDRMHEEDRQDKINEAINEELE